MFTNRHLNFGYLLVIVVAFVIAMSASCKLAYAEAEKEEILSSKPDEAFMVLIIKTQKNGKIRSISVGAGGIREDKDSAFVEDAKESELPKGTVVNELNEAIYVSNPCIYIRINGRLKKVCW